MKLSVTILLLVLSLCASANAQRCLEYGPTVRLTGDLHSRVFAGPPNYESIRRGDRKETAIILKLTDPVCVTGKDQADILVASETGIREVQLVVSNSAHWKTIRRLMNRRAIVSGSLFHAHTGHHRTQVLIEVTSLQNVRK